MDKIFIVGTPIGNMKDITLRALETLQEVDVIACEDTRVTRKLLSYHSINNKKLIAYHDKNEKNSSKGIIQMIQTGVKVAVVSDAGMPVINDPGFEVIRECLNSGIEIVVIPGVSATTMTAILSNLDTHFKFLGFLKPKTIQRQNQLKKLQPGSYVAFVSPHKMIATLEDIKITLGNETKIFVGRELTKKFETHYRGTIEEVIDSIKNDIKGEFTIAFEIIKKKVNKYAK
ncbi:MAG: 16S rRNA (cytidine(1402)-2'-O)-methyltransferase [Mycoplasmatales bacterium]|nr:16S rRNA (cytidine(1402)-2'-O)-methyltransferase [Mycoplasmatales bacterium]